MAIINWFRVISDARFRSYAVCSELFRLHFVVFIVVRITFIYLNKMFEFRTFTFFVQALGFYDKY